MICGSSFKNKGVQNGPRCNHQVFARPLDIDAVKGTDPETGLEISRKPDAKEPFAALALKS
jgi:elongation factor G